MTGDLKQIWPRRSRSTIRSPASPTPGALGSVRVGKFKAQGRQHLLGYHFFAKPNVIEVIDVGVHENFYRDFQQYLAAR